MKPGRRWLGSLAVLLALGHGPARGLAADRPNVVVIVADDHGLELGCYGHPAIKTPNLDRLAAEGTRFRNAFCTTASCSASRSVLLSGLHNHTNGQYGHQHSVHHFTTFGTVQSLPAILGQHGYRTARIGKFHVAPESVYPFQVRLPAPGGARSNVAMADACREFVADRSAPFFLYYATADPHRGGGPVAGDPLRPDAFGNNATYPGVVETTYDPNTMPVPPWLPDTPAARAELAQYARAVSRVDAGVGRLVQVLKDAGQYENTVIFYLSDNGPAFPGAKTTLYEPGMRLPLIVRDPGQSRRGVATDAMVSWVDITPTVLDFAGISEVIAPLRQGDPEEAPGAAGQARAAAKKMVEARRYTFHGRSFRGVLGQDRAEGWDEVFASHTFHEITMYYPMRVIRTPRHKLILNLAHQLPYPFASDLFASATWQAVLKEGPDARYGRRAVRDYIHRPRYELYDLESDPDEVVNLAGRPEQKALLDDLAGRLRRFQERTGDPWVVKYEYE